MNWNMRYHSTVKRIAVLLFAASIFVAGWGLGHDHHSSATANTVSAASSVDERREAINDRMVYEKLKDSYTTFSSRGEFIAYARGICLRALTHREICMSTPINIKRTPGADAIAVFNLSPSDNSATMINVDPSTLKSNPNNSAFLLTHEWNHLELALITGTVEKYNDMMDRAVYYYKSVDGKPITRARAMETETDCMALLHSNQPWIGTYPGYLRGLGSAGKDPYDANYTCRNWKDVLYGDPTVDYHATSSPATSNKVAVK